MWPKACRAAGLLGRIPHDFRRYAITNEADLHEAVTRLAALPKRVQGGHFMTSQRSPRDASPSKLGAERGIRSGAHA